MSSLSVLITARCEEWLPKTVADVLEHARGDTNVIVSLDGPGNPVVPEDPRVIQLHQPSVIGQRAGINAAARASSAKYVMKLDAHGSVDEGFDLKLMQPYETGEVSMQTTTIPRMYNLHVFNWKCKRCGNETYQGGPMSFCEACKTQHQDFERVIMWAIRRHKRTDFARFDSTLHFQYWRDYEQRPEAKGDICDLMSSVGACFFMPREWFFYLEGMDEAHGIWGQFGTEVSCKSWLSGGRQVVNKRTWFSHLFRTQVGFGFPYSNPGIGARRVSQDLWYNNKWRRQTRPLAWMIDKFWPVPDWDAETGKAALTKVQFAGSSFAAKVQPLMATHTPPPVTAPNVITSRKPTKGVVYYSDNRLDPKIFEACQKQILRNLNGHKLVSVTLEPIDFGLNRALDEPRGILTMFRQILLGLNDCHADYIFLAEHDVLYSPSHWKFVPPQKDIFYFNTNCWRVDANTGHALYYLCRQVSGCCASRELLWKHYSQLVKTVESQGFSRRMGFEPGSHRIEGVDHHGQESYRSKWPNLDIRHSNNLTPSRWAKEQFRDQRNCRDWKESDSVPGWGQTEGRFAEFIEEVRSGHR